MKAVYSLTLHDPVFTPRPYNVFDRYWLSFLNDERDLPFMHLTLKITLIMMPLGILLFFPFVTGWVWWTIALAYLYANNFMFKGPFGLMLHCTSHRPLFRKEYKFMNNYLPWVVAPFFGHSPETYYVHHVAMHHRENNLEEDLSSTMHYQRDSLGGFLNYLGNFLFYVVPSLSRYFNQHDQANLRNRVLRGEVLFWGTCVALSFISWQATLVVFVIPCIILRIIMMVGNWAQHSFVDPDDPGNFYKSSITCINTKYNDKCWNDGYHISHHLKPNLHWTLHPDHLLKNRDEYAKNKALVFEGIHYLHVWWYLMTKNYDALADKLVNLNGIFSSREEAIEVMKYRTTKIPKHVPVAA
jgi:hypothetical protein